jgi:hypothetical protein
MTDYIFNYKAIGIADKTRHGAYDKTGIWAVSAPDIFDALDKASERFKANPQFRFEYSYAGKDDDQT